MYNYIKLIKNIYICSLVGYKKECEVQLHQMISNRKIEFPDENWKNISIGGKFIRRKKKFFFFFSNSIIDYEYNKYNKIINQYNKDSDVFIISVVKNNL